MVVIPTAAMRGETMILRVTSVRARENINLQFPVAISNFQNSAQVGNPSRARSDLNSRISSSSGGQQSARKQSIYETRKRRRTQL